MKLFFSVLQWTWGRGRPEALHVSVAFSPSITATSPSEVPSTSISGPTEQQNLIIYYTIVPGESMATGLRVGVCIRDTTKYPRTLQGY